MGWRGLAGRVVDGRTGERAGGLASGRGRGGAAANPDLDQAPRPVAGRNPEPTQTLSGKESSFIMYYYRLQLFIVDPNTEREGEHLQLFIVPGADPNTEREG